MGSFTKTATVLASAAAMMLAPAAAMASGGVNSGGVNSGGGGGGGGGSVKSGGTTDVTTAPTNGVCANLTNVSDPVGYFGIDAAVWHNYTVKNCSSVSETVTVSVSDVNRATGQVEFTNVLTYGIAPGSKVQNMIDNDYAPYSTDYDIVTKVSDESENVLATQTIAATTPAQQ